MTAEQGFVSTGDIIPNENLDYQRRFFGCQDWSDEDLDTYVTMLEQMPDGAWLSGVPVDTRRVFAMSCIALKDKDPALYQRQIVEGKAWLEYG